MSEKIDVYKMKLHETKGKNGFYITRVPGGWIYQIDRGDGNYNTTFVPYHNEFQLD